MENQIAVAQPQAIAPLDSMALGYEVVLKRKHVVLDIMKHIMKDGVHYGVIKGCGDKPSLLKPGAEAISSTFQLSPRYNITKTELGGGHREYEIVCDLYALNGAFVGSGVGSATTMEGKYRFRTGAGEATEIQVPRGYWDKRKTDPKGASKVLREAANAAGVEGEHFGTQKVDGVWMITTKSAEAKVEHDNPADYYNTVLKMAKKRAFVDAILTTTGASDIFTQDIEDMPEVVPGAAKPAQGQPQGAGFQAPAGMDDMPSAPSAVLPIDLEKFAGFIAGIDSLAELEDEWRNPGFQARRAVSGEADQAKIDQIFAARHAALEQREAA